MEPGSCRVVDQTRSDSSIDTLKSPSNRINAHLFHFVLYPPTLLYYRFSYRWIIPSWKSHIYSMVLFECLSFYIHILCCHLWIEEHHSPSRHFNGYLTLHLIVSILSSYHVSYKRHYIGNQNIVGLSSNTRPPRIGFWNGIRGNIEWDSIGMTSTRESLDHFQKYAIHTYIHACMHAYIHTCMHACIHTYIHTYIHACIHTYMHAYIHSIYICI